MRTPQVTMPAIGDGPLLLEMFAPRFLLPSRVVDPCVTRAKSIGNSYLGLGSPPINGAAGAAILLGRLGC
jgi:hypothetical protein